MRTTPLYGESAPWNDAAIAVPQEAKVPTMLTSEEGRLLYWLARSPDLAELAAADLGCFAGGSTARIAAGLEAAGKTGRVHAFDFFGIIDAQKEKFLYPVGIRPFRGDDLLPIARKFLAPFGARVALHRGDICKAKWEDGPIGLLFIDAAKTPDTADGIAAGFFPHLVPGTSIVVQQDYLHWRQPWVAAQMELFADCFELAGWCAENSVLFRCTRLPTSNDLAAARTAEQDDAAIMALLRQAIGRFTTRPQQVALARMILALEDNPGQRSPRGFDRTGFTHERVDAAIRTAL